VGDADDRVELAARLTGTEAQEALRVVLGVKLLQGALGQDQECGKLR
jgi:hypothetical protein